MLLPTGDIYSKLTVDLLRGSAIGEATGIEDTTGSSPFYATSARLMGFFPLGDDSDLEVGLSGYTGIHDPYNRDRFWYANLDFKYKYRPDAYTSLGGAGRVPVQHARRSHRTAISISLWMRTAIRSGARSTLPDSTCTPTISS